jgi:hypothetical protein
MSNHEKINHYIRPAPDIKEVARPELEQKLRNAVTPERARLIAFAATGSREMLSPSSITIQQDLEEKIKNASADNLPFTAGEKVSEERRKDYWQEGDRKNLNFGEKNKQWNESMHEVIINLITPSQDNDKIKTKRTELARETLQNLGLTGADTTEVKTFESARNGNQKFNLYSDIEAFRKTYFDTKSDIKSFVGKIAEQCPGVDEQIDVGSLKNRLEAIKFLLTSFGDQSVDSLVEDFAISYGLMTQKNGLKEVIANEVKTNLDTPIVQEKETLIKKLAEKQEEIERADTQNEEKERARQQASVNQQEQTQKNEELLPLDEIDWLGDEFTFTQAIQKIENTLTQDAGEDVKLTTEQKKLIKDKKIHPIAFTNSFFGIQEISSLEGKYKNHDEIMHEVIRVFNTSKINREGKIETLWISPEGDKFIDFYKIHKY